jgi:hypothetical protein
VAVPPVVVPVPSVVAPFLKVTTSPSGIEPDAELTVAVNASDWLMFDGFSEEVTTVVVANFESTDWLRAEVLPVLLISPTYCTVMERLPAVANDVVRLAWLLLNVSVPIFVAPDLKMIEPVTGPPYWPTTVAVNVVDALISAGFRDETTRVVALAFATLCEIPEVLPFTLLSPL